MLTRRRYWILVAAVCNLLPSSLAGIANEAHRSSNQFDRVHSFTAAIVSFSGCANGTSENNGSLRRLHLQELVYGHWPWLELETVAVRCPEALAPSLLAGIAASGPDCSSWTQETKYLVTLAIRDDNTSCLLQNELLLSDVHFRTADDSSGEIIRESSVITRASGVRKRSGPDFHVIDKIHGIGQSELVVDGEFQDGITIEVSGGRDNAALNVLLLPSLWSVYAWIGADHRKGGKPIKNGFDVSKGKFYAVTRIQYSSGENVSVTQRGSGLDRDILQVDTRIDGTLPRYDLSDPESIKHDDYDLVLLKVNSTTLSGRAERSLTLRGRTLSYTQETTLTVKKVDAFKQSAMLSVQHLERRRTFKQRKVHISIEAEIERARKQDISTACCDHGSARAYSGKNCALPLDACSSEEVQSCCECCARGRKKARESKECNNKDKDLVCQRKFKECCTRDIRSTEQPSIIPTDDPTLRDEIRLLCCSVGSTRHLQGDRCHLLLPQFCGSVAQWCCECCQKGIRDARRTGQCKKEGGLPECRAARGHCCEKRLNEMAATTQPPLETPTIISGPTEIPQLHQILRQILSMFKPAGSSSVSGVVSGHRVSHMRIQVGLNLSSHEESKIFCSFLHFPDSISHQQLDILMSISSLPFAWLLAVETSIDKQLNPFLEMTDLLEIEGTVQFESKGSHPSKALTVNCKVHILEKHIVEVDFTFNGDIPSTVNSGPIELTSYDMRVGRFTKREISHGSEVINPVYEVTVLRTIQVNGEPFAIGMQLEASSQNWVKGMLTPDEQRVSVHESNVIVDGRKKERHLYLRSQASTSSYGRILGPGVADKPSTTSTVTSSTQLTNRLTEPTATLGSPQSTTHSPTTVAETLTPSLVSSHSPSVTPSARVLPRPHDASSSVIAARGTFTGIINGIEIDEVPFHADLHTVTGTLRATITQLSTKAATSVLQLLPIGLPLYLAYVTNTTKLSAVSLEAEVTIDNNHIVGLTYAVSDANSRGYADIHVTAYGTLPSKSHSSLKLKKYELSMIQTSRAAVFIGATSKILVGDQAAIFTLRGKAVWKADDIKLVDGVALISTRMPQVEEELSLLKVLFKVTMSIVQHPDFTDGCCLFGHTLAADSGHCRRKSEFPDVCNVNKASKCCKCCFNGHQKSLGNIATSHLCLEQDYDGTKACQKTAKNCCIRQSHHSVTADVPMRRIQGTLTGFVNSLPVTGSIIDGQFDTSSGTFSVVIRLGDTVHHVLHQSSALLVPIVNVISWMTASPSGEGANGIGSGCTGFAVESNVTYGLGDEQLYFSQTGRITRGGSLDITTMLDGDIPMLVFLDDERPLMSDVSSDLVQVGHCGFHLATDNYQLKMNGRVGIDFKQALTVTIDGLRSNDSLPRLQQVGIKFDTVAVNESSMTLTVIAKATVTPTSELDASDSCCTVGRTMALSGFQCPQDVSACGGVLNTCCDCCQRGVLALGKDQKSCRVQESSHWCRDSFGTCCGSFHPVVSATVPPVLPIHTTTQSATSHLTVATSSPLLSGGCADVVCPPGQRCMTDSKRRPVCRCYNQCRHGTSLEFCCGTDNRTYGSRCLLKNIACMLSTRTEFAYAGECNMAGRSICNCNGYSETCHAETGACTDCRFNTIGRHCDRCRDGYYGHPSKGQPEACKPCMCPGQPSQNHFSPTCHLDRFDRRLVCNACAVGHMGRQCQLCSDGFYGMPKRRSRGGCYSCTCSGNVNKEQFGNCDRRTGRCLKCLYNTAGHVCHQCKDGFYGDAVILKSCNRCRCNTIGSVNNICHHRYGNCECRDSVGGDLCNRCAPGYWGFGRHRNTVCANCDCCEEGSVSNTCNQTSGKCTCKLGFSGQKCCERTDEEDPQ